ncbi:MAG: glutathione S-transferase [Alphaproteobacteria bacterium]|nr:glutathione S-transferase [Alphaproteobacteria bacterium]
MQLISATPSPYARKVRIALAEKGIPFELITEVPWNPGTATPHYNPLEKLPVLLLDDGGSVYESSHILEWLETKYPTPALLPADADAALDAKRLQVLADGVCDALVLIIFERLRPAAQHSQPWQERQLRKVHGGVREIARSVGEREFAVGDRFGLADLAIGSLLGFLSLRFAEFDWRAQYPDLAAYGDRLDARPSFRATKPAPQTIRAGVV